MPAKFRLRCLGLALWDGLYDGLRWLTTRRLRWHGFPPAPICVSWWRAVAVGIWRTWRRR